MSEPHALGAARWMVLALDATDPERVMVGHCVPTVQQMEFAISLGRALNKRVNEGGAWVVSWSAPHADGVPARLAYAWVDRDGDMPFTVDTEEAMQVLQTAGTEPYVRQGHAAWAEYHEHIKASEISPSQMIKQRAGQAVRDPSQLVPADFG